MSGLSGSFSVGFGFGDTGYFMGHHPVSIVTTDMRSFQYSPSWTFRYDKRFWLSKHLEFSIGISHLSITEKPNQVASPQFFDDHLSQAFIHIIPSISLQIQEEDFIPYLGIRVGTANFIGSSDRESSNSLGKLNADFALDYGISFRLSKRFRVYTGMIQGLSKYDYDSQEPVTYYKYHTFQGGVTYQLHEKK